MFFAFVATLPAIAAEIDSGKMTPGFCNEYHEPHYGAQSFPAVSTKVDCLRECKNWYEQSTDLVGACQFHAGHSSDSDEDETSAPTDFTCDYYPGSPMSSLPTSSPYPLNETGAGVWCALLGEEYLEEVEPPASTSTLSIVLLDGEEGVNPKNEYTVIP